MMSPRVSLALFVAGLGVLCFSLGASLATFKRFPYRVVENVYLGGKAALETVSGKRRDRSTMAWHRCRWQSRGVRRHTPAQTHPGYTLYSSAHAQSAFLVDMDGRVAHEWHLPYDSIWDRSSEVEMLPDERYVYWRKARVFPDGSLLALYVEAAVTPWGLGLVKVDRSSKVVWKFLKRVHHDFWIGGDGRIYTLTHRFRHKPVVGLPNIRVPFLDDFVTILSADGAEVDNFSVYSALARSPFKPHLLRAPANEKGDYLHTNAIEVLEPELAGAFPFARAGQLLVSMRDLNYIGIIDPETKLFVWGTAGVWLSQHDPDFLPNGNILLFDNLGRLGKAGGKSRVIEFDPQTSEIKWCYEGTIDDTLFSEVRSSQQRLANGNTLITESDAGRILEVSPDKRVVWEFVNPASRDGGAMVAVVCWATRMAPEEFGPDFRAALEAGGGPAGGGQ